MQPPGFRCDWHAGVRVKSSGKLVAFISAVPAEVVAAGSAIRAVEINFLCVHKRLRSKRLAPVLIKEITRRVNLQGIWQAAYTAGVVLPKPVAVCRYWHRSLNPKKLIEVGFSSLAPRMTLARTIKLYKLPSAPATPGLRPMAASDAPAVAALLNDYLSRFKLAQRFSAEEARHWLTPREMVVDTWVVEAGGCKGAAAGAAGTANGSSYGSGGSGSGGDGPSTNAATTNAANAAAIITDVVSFYTLPSSVLGHPEHKEIRAAYMFYTGEGWVDWVDGDGIDCKREVCGIAQTPATHSLTPPEKHTQKKHAHKNTHTHNTRTTHNTQTTTRNNSRQHRAAAAAPRGRPRPRRLKRVRRLQRLGPVGEQRTDAQGPQVWRGGWHPAVLPLQLAHAGRPHQAGGERPDPAVGVVGGGGEVLVGVEGCGEVWVWRGVSGGVEVEGCAPRAPCRRCRNVTVIMWSGSAQGVCADRDGYI